MAYKSKFKGKEIDDRLDLVQELSEDISDIKEDIKNTIQEETDPIFSTSPASTITENDKAAWSNKQDAISDLTTIREGASKGATSVQPADLTDYISKDDVDTELSETSTNPIQNKAVNDAFGEMAYAFGQFLSEKQDTISDLDTIRAGAEKGATALQSVPSNYITASKLASMGYATTSQVDAKQDTIRDLNDIRSGAAKGVTSLQPSDVDSEILETSTNPVQNKVVAGALYEIVDMLDTALSNVGERFNDKQDKLVSGENIKTINGKSILGEGNITIEGGSGVDNVQSDWNENDSSSSAYVKSRTHYFVPWGDEHLLIADDSTVDTILFSVGASYFKIGSKVYSTERMLNKEFNCADSGPSIIVKVVLDDDGYTFGVKHISGSTISDLPNYYVAAGEVKHIDDVYIPDNIARYKDGYVYSNGEKVDMRIRRSLIPIGTLIPAKANLNTIAYLKVGNYYCSQTANAKTITNCPVEVAFSMEVFNPLSETLDDETTSTYTYRIRKITAYNTGVQYMQYCNTSGTAGTWTYGSWYVVPRTSFSLASDKNGGSAVKGASNRGVYIDASGTFQQMSYTIAKSVPSNAVFTDTDTKVTSVDNHYAPAEDADAAINAPEGEVVVGLKRDAAGHIVGVMSTPMSSGGGGGGGGITVEKDPIFSASPAATITEEKIAMWDDAADLVGPLDQDIAQLYRDLGNKQDTITDIETIRSGASKGETSVQPSEISEFITVEDLAEVATSGSYNDLHNKPTIPSAVNIAGTNYTPSDGGIIDLNPASLYRKPSTGIPKEDLSSEVQSSLRNADVYKGTVTQIKINGKSISPNDGEIDLGNIPTSIPSEVYITDFDIMSLESLIYNNIPSLELDKQGLMDALERHKVILVPYEIADNNFAKGYCTLVGYYEDLLYLKVITEYSEIIIETSLDNQYIFGQEVIKRRWQDKQDTLQSGENIKTINGESILGSGDITAGSAQLPLNKVILIFNGERLAIPSGKVTNLTLEQKKGCTFVLSTDSKKDSEDNVWVIRFSISIDNSGIYQVNAGEGYSIKWANGVAPTFENGKYYEMSFRLIGTTFLGVWASFE